MSDHDGGGAFLSGLLIGGMLGAAIALILAPQSGEETRRIIKDKALELGKEIREQADVIKEKGRQVLTQDGIEIDEAPESTP
ncbi:MAG: YtxH domain-containing protein [Caldisericota bacterium]|jgi:gas vesicle protein|nr:YtxH domain-containing protein [Caldisericota bacterium]